MNLHLQDRLDIEITACEMMPEEALTTFILYLTHIVSLRVRSEIRSRIKCVMLTNDIIVLDSYFSLTNKSNLIGRL